MSWVEVASGWLEESGDIRAGAAQLYRDLVDGLSPVLGVGGVGLLFARSMNLTARRFPFIEQVFTLHGTEAMADRLLLTLTTQDDATAREASVTLFANFLGLLESLLGAALTTKLLEEIKPDARTDTSGTEEPMG